MKRVYPFQVPAAETIAAKRESAPRDHFRVTTSEVEDERNTSERRDAENAVGFLGQPTASSSAVDSSELRQECTTSESTEL